MKSLPNSSRSELAEILFSFRKFFYVIGGFSLVINLLMLLPSVYMLQIYDRVLVSRSETTLWMLTAMTLALYGVMELMEYIRSATLIRLGNHLDAQLNQRVFTASFERQLRRGSGSAGQAMNDVTAVRQFLSGSGVFAAFDLPWLPINLLICFLFHPWLGAMVLAGCIMLTLLAVLTEIATRSSLLEANQSMLAATAYANNNLNNAEAIEAMGMLPAIRARWHDYHLKMMAAQTLASDRAARINALTKFVRIGMQSAVLGLGALLVLDGKISGGMMIACSILMGRALQPVEQAIGAWKQLVHSRAAYKRLQELMQAFAARGETMPLPAPRGVLTVEQAVAVAPNSQLPIVRGVSFGVSPGEIVGVVGPSASGKSTLARLLVGVWPAQAGHVRLDGANIYQWNKDELGPYLGYLPQDIELFEGSIAENIARFGELDAEKVVAAAKLAGVHEMILRLSKGYDTELGLQGSHVSGGQRQRIALARALYGMPSLVVLDEPNSNLDDQGEAALLNAVRELKAQNRTVILITHRTNILNIVDKLMVLREGQIQHFGPRDEVLAALLQSAQQAQSQKAAAPVAAPN